MESEPQRNPLDYASPHPVAHGRRNYLFWTWLGPAAFVVCYLIAMFLSALRIAKPAVQGSLLLCFLAPIVGMVFAVKGMDKGLNGCAMVLGLGVNVLLICLQVIVLGHWFLNR